MAEGKEWLWLIQTNQGDFFMTVVGKWTQGEAARLVWQLFELLKLEITGMVQRKRSTGPDDIQGTIYQEPEYHLGYYFFAGRRFWEISGRAAEYDAEIILGKKRMELGD